MILNARLIVIAVVVTGTFVRGVGQPGFIQVPANIQVRGVPAIPQSLARDLDPYLKSYGLPLAGWDPSNREILLKGLSSVAWVSRVKTPGSEAITSRIYIGQNGIYDLYFQKQGSSVAYTRDTNGNEFFQLYVYDISTGQSTLLSDPKARSTEPVWSNSGQQIVYSSFNVGTPGVSLRLVNPTKNDSDRLLVQTSGGYLKAFDWSPDDKQIVYVDSDSTFTGTLWLIDLESGEKTRLSDVSDIKYLFDDAQFGKDGKGVFVLTDSGSDLRRIAYIDITSRKASYIPQNTRWDVEEFQVAPNGQLLAYITNDSGTSHLHVLNLKTHQELTLPSFESGLISDLKWNEGSNEVAFNFNSSKTPNDVYSFVVDENRFVLWAKSILDGVDAEKLHRPELIYWNSFDDRVISGYLYQPPANFKGKRPVIIDIHGGPAEQYRPGFEYEQNYFVNELGVVRICPNIRGSTGYGKQFSDLDNTLQREAAVEDVGALLDWIKSRPELDADRILVLGSSYGGYMALSVGTQYNDRIKAIIADSAISNLVTFIEHTEGWRRDLQRSEFGDERDPKIRAFLERISPLTNAKTIKRPLLIIHGRNDPRVPLSEAMRLFDCAKMRIPVWFVLANNEGHGFSQLANRNYKIYATALFVKEYLLK